MTDATRYNGTVLGKMLVRSEGDGKALDAQEPHIRAMLNFIGITDIEFLAQYWTLLWSERYAELVTYSDNIRQLDFSGDDRPSRRIAMAWRRSSAMTGFLEQLAQQFKRLPQGLFALESTDVPVPSRTAPL